MESLLTIDELSQWLKVKKQTIYIWASKDEIPSYKVGGKRRFDPDEIRKWLKRRSAG